MIEIVISPYVCNETTPYCDLFFLANFVREARHKTTCNNTWPWKRSVGYDLHSSLPILRRMIDLTYTRKANSGVVRHNTTIITAMLTVCKTSLGLRVSEVSPGGGGTAPCCGAL